MLSSIFPCDYGYIQINNTCYFEDDIYVLQHFIDSSQNSIYPPPADMSPLDLGVQEWENGRITFFCYSYISESECYIYDYTLSGQIPPEIGNLTQLRRLIIATTQLSGEIPPEIGNLVNLTELKIYMSDISGNIPDEIGNLINLTDLYLKENNLSGSIPNEINNLTQLDRLFLEYNELDGQIPSNLENLQNLRYLNLKHNNFNGQIPETLGNLSNIIGLSVAHNELTGYIPENICNIADNNIYVYLYGNELCPPYPDCLTNEQLNGSWMTGGGVEDEQDTSTCPECLIGDANNDLILNISDVLILIDHILYENYVQCSDMNFDDVLNVQDVILILNNIIN